MKNAGVALVLVSFLTTSCSTEESKVKEVPLEKDFQLDKETQLDSKIKEASRIFEKYGWEIDPAVDRKSKEFRAEYEKMDLEQLDAILKIFHEGVEYNNLDSSKIIRKDKRADYIIK